MVVGEPQAGVEVQLLEALRVAGLQATTKEVGEQVVEAVPLALTVERQEEQLHGFQPLQQGLAVVAAGQGVGQVATELAGDAEGQQGVLQVAGQLLEDAGQQVLADRGLVAAQAFHLPGGLGLVAQPEARQLHPDRPPFGMAVQGRQYGIIQLQAGLGQVVAGFFGGQAQFVEADLQQPALGAQGGQAERRQRAAADRQAEAGRGQAHQAAEGGVEFRVLDQVQVVQHQQERAAVPGEVHQQAFQHGVDRHLHGVLQVAPGVVAQSGHRVVQGLDQLLEEARRVVVLGLQGKPGDGAAGGAALLGQGRQGGGLAEPGGCREQQETGMGMGGQGGLDPGSGQIVGGCLGGDEFGALTATGRGVEHCVHCLNPYVVIVVERRYFSVGFFHNYQNAFPP
ncbi:hypothetical protein D9M70_414000 [compost metagenome]